MHGHHGHTSGRDDSRPDRFDGHYGQGLSTERCTEHGEARRRRSSTPEFKAGIVGLGQQDGWPVGQMAKDFGVTETSDRGYVRQVERKLGPRRG
jgi:hypothetical protein